MKSLILIALFCCFIYAVQGGVNGRIREDDCAHCAGDIAKAVADCQVCIFFRRKNTIQMQYYYYMINKLFPNVFQNQDVDLLTCIQDALGAASDCLRCICDILNAIGGGDGVCENPPQKFKKLL